MSEFQNLVKQLENRYKEDIQAANNIVNTLTSKVDDLQATMKELESKAAADSQVAGDAITERDAKIVELENELKQLKGRFLPAPAPEELPSYVYLAKDVDLSMLSERDATTYDLLRYLLDRKCVLDADFMEKMTKEECTA